MGRFRLAICIASLIFVVFSQFRVTLSQERLTANPDKTVEVGVVLGLTGLAAEDAKQIRDGIELAKDELENQGWTVNLRYQDDTTSAINSVSAVHLLSSLGVQLIIGPAWTSQVAAVLPVLEQRQVVAFAPAVSSEVIGGATNPYIFFGASYRSAYFEHILPIIKEFKLSRVLIVCPDHYWGRAHSAGFVAALAKAGLEPLALEYFNYGQEQTALPAILNRYRSKKPDLILATGSAASFGFLVTQLHKFQMEGHLIGTQALVDAKHDGLFPANVAHEKLYVIRSVIQPEFAQKFQERYGRSARLYSDNAYDGLKILALAWEHSDRSIAGITKYLRESLDYQGASGRLDFDQQGDRLSALHEIVRLDCLSDGC